MKAHSFSSAAVPKCVLITGATGGIGSALALEYARAGTTTLILQGRNAARLQELTRTCNALGTRVISCQLDVRDHDALIDWLAGISAAEAPDLVIANAGVNINTGASKQGEAWDDKIGRAHV